MSFGSSDIVTGVRLAWRIWEYGFVQENAADVRYKNFRNDVLNFHYLLEKLDRALKDASQRYRDRRPVLGVQAYDPLSEDFEKERKTIVGNFISTLQECERLLETNKKWRVQSSNVAQNLYWNLSKQEQSVEFLRRRLHFHSEKIRLVLDRLSINLLTDIDSKVEDILALSEQNLLVSQNIYFELTRNYISRADYAVSGADFAVSPQLAIESSHAVSTKVAERFQDHLLVDAPGDFSCGIPLAEGFDALLVHFNQSDDGQDQTPDKYLLFLKTRWLLSRLKECDEYQKARPGFYYKRAVNQIEQAITVKMRQPGKLINFDESTLMELQDSHFQIWPPTEMSSVEYSQPHPLMTRGDEVLVSRIELQSATESAEPDTVTIFKSSDERLRLVHTYTLPSALGDKIVTPQPVHVLEDRLIPRYALPTLENPCLEMAIFSRNEERLYKFNSLSDLLSFQGALMGFDVSHDQDGITCQFGEHAASLDCIGRVQLWQVPIAPPISLENSDCDTSLRTRGSASERSLSRNGSLQSTSPKSTIFLTADGWEADTIKLPSLTIFSKLSDHRNRARFAMIFVDLEPGIYIEPAECACSRDYNTCSKLVLKHRKRSHFYVRVAYSNVDAEGQPDSNTFDIFPARLPPHPKAPNLPMMRTEYLLLKFKSLEEKIQFHEEIRDRFLVRDAQIENQLDFEAAIRRRQDRPQGHRRPPAARRKSSPPLRESLWSRLIPPILNENRHHATSRDASPGADSAEAGRQDCFNDPTFSHLVISSANRRQGNLAQHSRRDSGFGLPGLSRETVPRPTMTPAQPTPHPTNIARSPAPGQPRPNSSLSRGSTQDSRIQDPESVEDSFGYEMKSLQAETDLSKEKPKKRNSFWRSL